MTDDSDWGGGTVAHEVRASIGTPFNMPSLRRRRILVRQTPVTPPKTILYISYAIRHLHDYGANWSKKDRVAVERILPELLRRIFDLDERSTYQPVFVGLLSFERQCDRSRNLAGKALMVILDFCKFNNLPLFNMLIVDKQTKLPSGGAIEWYRNQFGSLQGYDAFCVTEAHKALTAIKSGIVTLKH